MSKKEKSKKGKKPKIQYPLKVTKAYLEKKLKQEALDLAVIHAAIAWTQDPTDPQLISGLRAAVERLSSEDCSSPAPEVEVEQPWVDFSLVMVDGGFRLRVYNELDTQPKLGADMRRALNCVTQAVVKWRGCAGAAERVHPFSNSVYSTDASTPMPGIDLATLIAVTESVELQREVSKLMGRSSFMGPVGVAALTAFVLQAKALVLADVQNTSTS